MRIPTFILGLLVVAGVIFGPRLIAADMQSVPYPWLVLLLLGMSACFVSGIGFKPKNRFLRILFSIPAAWLMVLVSATVIVYKGPYGSLIFG